MSKNQRKITRRKFVKNSAMCSSALWLSQIGKPLEALYSLGQPDIYIFSKHLQFLEFKNLAAKAKLLGFNGVDLTVRNNGHVNPREVGKLLATALNNIKAEGLRAKMITTDVSNPTLEITKSVLAKASELGVQYYRMNWFSYLDNKSIPYSIETRKKDLKNLSKLNRKLGLIGMYQNHAGLRMGASLWELYQMLSDTDADYLGVQFDIRHAIVEGGKSWKRGLELLTPYIKSIVLKDFKWIKKEDGSWDILNTPIGEGMVDFTSFFKIVKSAGLHVPMSLHLEYPLGGAEHGKTDLSIDREIVFSHMESDLKKVRQLWANA